MAHKPRIHYPAAFYHVILRDNGSEFTARLVREWLKRLKVKTLFPVFIFIYSTPLPHTINGKLRDELLNGEIFYTLKEAQILTEQWRKEYNTVRPHSSLGYKPPAPETIALNYRERTKKEEKKTLIQ